MTNEPVASRQAFTQTKRLDRNVITVFELGPDEADRQRFTLAHELGHHFLTHGEVLESERCQAEDIGDSDAVLQISNRHLRQMEIQANVFASLLLLPTRQLLHDMEQLAAEFGLRDKGFGLIYLDEQPCNITDYLRIVSRLRVQYQASRTAIKYRLKDLGLLTEARSPRRLHDG